MNVLCILILCADPLSGLTPQQIKTHVYNDYQSRINNSDELFYPALEASAAFESAESGQLSLEHRRAVLRQLQHQIDAARKEVAIEEERRQRPSNRLREMLPLLEDRHYADRFLREELVKMIWNMNRDDLRQMTKWIVKQQDGKQPQSEQ